MKKLTHQELIEYAKSHAVDIIKITRKFVYLNTTESKYWWPANEKPVNIDLLYATATGKYSGVPLKMLIDTKMKIGAIINIREQTKLGLKEAKDFVEINFKI
jgi:hypothetical protein